MAVGKRQTDTVEGVNADLRHYLARLGRRSRCFSRCIHALRRAIALFVHFYNQHRLQLQQHTRYPLQSLEVVHRNDRGANASLLTTELVIAEGPHRMRYPRGCDPSEYAWRTDEQLDAIGANLGTVPR